MVDANIPWDRRYFESLNRIVQIEPSLTRDKAMIDQLKSIGSEKSKPFNPDAKMQDTLKAAVREAHAWLASKYEGSYFPAAYYEGGHWYLPASPEVIEGLQTRTLIKLVNHLGMAQEESSPGAIN